MFSKNIWYLLYFSMMTYYFILGPIGIIMTFRRFMAALEERRRSKDKPRPREDLLRCRPCLYSMAGIAAVAILVFVFKPIDYAYSVTKLFDDWRWLCAMVVMLIVVLEAEFVCMKHYWLWIYTAPFIILFANFYDKYNLLSNFREFVFLGVAFAMPIVPIASLLYRRRSRLLQEKRHEAIDEKVKESPT